MWKYALSFIALFAFGVLLFPKNETSRIESLSPAAELQMKRATMSQDVKLTDDLCRTQCSMELGKVLQHNQSKQPTADKKLKELQYLQSHHPQMKHLIWTAPEKKLQDSITVGSLTDTNRSFAESELLKAKAKADKGESYQSEPYRVDGSTYFVLGVPSPDHKEALLGVVKQDILKQVEEHQMKNLRIVTYPSDNRYKIESVDANNLKDVKVRHPEDNEGTSHYHVSQVVVKFKTEPSAADLAKIKSDIAATGFRKVGYTYVFESKHMEAKQLMNYFKSWNVEYAEPHFLYMTNTTYHTTSSSEDATANAMQTPIIPNDSLYQRYQWNLPLIDTEKGWSINKGSDQIKVAVVDTGVDLNHPDLKDQLVSGFNVVQENAEPLDDVGHGTHVAGVVGALVNNNLGVAGMSWYNRIMPVKVLDQTGAGSTYSVAQGIIWATDNGAKVINLSLGNYAEANFLHDAIKYAYDHDVVLIAASGNDNTSQPGYPAAYPEVLAVAATDANKNKASFSNYGSYIGVAAPGVNIASTYPHNQYAALSGTSMASPHVTALAALIRSVNPDLKNTEVMDIIRNTAQDIGPEGKDEYFGSGLIDVVAALKSAEASKSPQNAAVKESTGGSEQQVAEPDSSLWSDWRQRLLDRLNRFQSKFQFSVLK